MLGNIFRKTRINVCALEVIHLLQKPSGEKSA